jgi:hypothetical protein
VQEREFLEKAGEELEKVNKFYAAQEADMLARGAALVEQLRILADVKRILADHAVASRRSRPAGDSPPPPPSADGRSNSGRHLLSSSSPFLQASPQSMLGRSNDQIRKHVTSAHRHVDHMNGPDPTGRPPAIRARTHARPAARSFPVMEAFTEFQVNTLS